MRQRLHEYNEGQLCEKQAGDEKDIGSIFGLEIPSRLVKVLIGRDDCAFQP